MKNKRGQPRKEIKRIPVKLTLLPSIRAKGGFIASKENKSLSRLLEDFIKEKYDEMLKAN